MKDPPKPVNEASPKEVSTPRFGLLAANLGRHIKCLVCDPVLEDARLGVNERDYLAMLKVSILQLIIV